MKAISLLGSTPDFQFSAAVQCPAGKIRKPTSPIFRLFLPTCSRLMTACLLLMFWTQNSMATATPNDPETVNSPMGIIECPEGSVTPTVEIFSPSGAEFCAGVTVYFYATSTNEGDYPIYEWKKNGIVVGTNSYQYTDNALANGDILTVELNSSHPDACPEIVLSAEFVVTIHPLPATPTLPAQPELCINDYGYFDKYYFTGGSPAGGSYNFDDNPYNLTNFFKPAWYGVGSFPLYYVAIDPVTGCHSLPSPTQSLVTGYCGQPCEASIEYLPFGCDFYSLGAIPGLSNIDYQFQWKKDGTDIPGATNGAFNVFAADVPGSFSVVVTDPTGGCVVESEPTVLASLMFAGPVTFENLTICVNNPPYPSVPLTTGSPAGGAYFFPLEGNPYVTGNPSVGFTFNTAATGGPGSSYQVCYRSCDNITCAFVNVEDCGSCNLTAAISPTNPAAVCEPATVPLTAAPNDIAIYNYQ